MYNEHSIMKTSKKEIKKELLSFAKQAWQYYRFDDAENTEKFRFYFNYFLNNNREVQEVDYMYDEQFSHPHFHYVKDKYPKLAAKIEEELEAEGIDLHKMKEKFDKIISTRDNHEEYEI